MLHGLGLDTGIDLPALIETGRWLSALLGRANGSKVGLAGISAADGVEPASA
jgi:hydroxymethylglutaryl-CoA lyase